MRSFLQRLAFLAVFACCPQYDVLADGESLLVLVEETELRPGTLEHFLSSHYVKRFQIVTIDANRLREEARIWSNLAEPMNGKPIRFDLFNDLSLLFHPTLVEGNRAGALAGLVSWGGEFRSNSEFFATISLHMDWNDEVNAAIRTSMGRILIEPTKKLPYHIVWLQDFEAEQKGRENGR
ncbi:MAG: hypothetical protein OEW68_07380 [Gammaproteobacteria bacterium]|nr:hypothetical protein [Gammaproteobacteria bacterium]MDH5212882.1 hypothetical protein [Gammaproteobacteria bacterium]